MSKGPDHVSKKTEAGKKKTKKLKLLLRQNKLSEKRLQSYGL